MVTAATSLRRALENPDSFIVAPGVYDGLSARVALSAGFDALYMVSGECHYARILVNQLIPLYRPVPVPLPRSMVKQTWASALSTTCAPTLK